MENMGSIAGKDSAGAVDLERQPRVRVGCHLCGSARSRLVCSPEDIAAQHRFLEAFYRSHWSRQDTTTATDRVHFTQDYSTAIVTCMECSSIKSRISSATAIDGCVSFSCAAQYKWNSCRLLPRSECSRIMRSNAPWH